MSRPADGTTPAHRPGGPTGRPTEPVDEHWSRVILRADTDVVLARYLAGWAEFLTVEEPAAVRHELRRLGAALTAE